MPYPRLPSIRPGKDLEQSIQFLTDAYNKLRKEIGFLLMGSLDDDNVLSLDASKIRNLTAEQIFTDVITAGTSINHVLYAKEGRIARLTVDHLLTGDFLAGSPKIYFIEAKDQYLKFIEGTRNDALPQVQYTTEPEDGEETGDPLYWDSAEHNYMTPLETEWPVMVYVYDLLTKREINFELDPESGYTEPKDIYGAGAGNPDHPTWGKGYDYKSTTRFLRKYISSAGKEKAVYLTDTGLEIVNTTSGDVEQKITFSDDGIIQTGNTGEQGLRNIHISTTEPATPQTNDLWIDTDDYSRYDISSIGASGTIAIEGAEVIFASGTITVTLFTAAGNAGVVRIIKNTGTGTVTIDGYSGETIDGAATKTLTANQFCTIISDGANWQVIG